MSDSVRPHRQQPTRLPHPWDSPGKNTGAGCHFLPKIGEREVRAAVAALKLLAQRMERRDRLRPRLVGVARDVVAAPRRGPEAEDRLRIEPALLDDTREHRLAVLEESARRLALLGVVEDGGKTALEFPGLKE